MNPRTHAILIALLVPLFIGTQIAFPLFFHARGFDLVAPWTLGTFTSAIITLGAAGCIKIANMVAEAKDIIGDAQ